MSEFLKLYEKTDLRERKLNQLLTELDESDREALLTVLADKKITGTSIAQLLRKMGYTISDRAVQRYRKEVIWA